LQIFELQLWFWFLINTTDELHQTSGRRIERKHFYLVIVASIFENPIVDMQILKTELFVLCL